MAAVGGDRGRKLRTRVVAATSAAPLTRSAAAAASLKALQHSGARVSASRGALKRDAALVNSSRSSSTAHLQQARKRPALANLTNCPNIPSTRNSVPPPQKPLVTSDSNNICASQHAESKGALKRAAALGNSSRSSPTAHLQQARKRPALASLTNCSNIPSTRNSILPPQKPPVNRKGRQPREVNAYKENVCQIYQKENETSVPVAAQNNEVSSVEGDTGLVEISKAAAPSYACAATQTSASLEVRTEHYVSQGLEARTRQGYSCDDYLEGEGWSCKNYTNIDENIKDPQMCGSYAPEIYYYLQMAELKRRPTKNFMEAVQQDINPSMRGILVDWLVEVAEEYKLVPDTLYLTIAYVDRFLSGNMVNRQRLQLLGISCMLIASKYEEICAPLVEDFCNITDNTYCRDEVLQMEKRVLNVLQFELTGPTTKTFLRRFIRAAQAGQKTPTLQLEYLGNYLAELTLLEYGFLQYLPSMIAGSAVFLAKFTLNPSVRPWTSTLEHYSGYKASELVDCVYALYDLQSNKKKCTLPAVREKYKHQKYKSVANLTPPAVIPPKFFEDVDDADL